MSKCSRTASLYWSHSSIPGNITVPKRYFGSTHFREYIVEFQTTPKPTPKNHTATNYKEKGARKM